MSAGGVDWSAFQAAAYSWVLAGSGLASDKVVWAQQDAPRPAGPAIEMRVSNIAETGRVWKATEDNPLAFADETVTAVSAAADTLTIASHGLLTGDGPVRVSSTGTLPGGLAASTDYWVVAVDASTIKLAASYANSGGGQGAGNPITPIDLTSAGAGTIKLQATPRTARAGQELLELARGYLRLTLELRCHSAAGVGVDMATAILQRVRTRREWSSQQATLWGANVGLLGVDRIRAIQGMRDAMLFEPRAMLEVHLCVPVEEGQATTFIQQALLTNTSTGKSFAVTGPQ